MKQYIAPNIDVCVFKQIDILTSSYALIPSDEEEQEGLDNTFWD